jgi:hypothetical protein
MTEHPDPEGEMAEIRLRLRSLIRQARDKGYVITVDLESLEPLAMGNYCMIEDVRPARNSAQPSSKGGA